MEMPKLQGKVAVEGAKVIAADINQDSLNSVVDEICTA